MPHMPVSVIDMNQNLNLIAIFCKLITLDIFPAFRYRRMDLIVEWREKREDLLWLPAGAV